MSLASDLIFFFNDSACLSAIDYNNYNSDKSVPINSLFGMKGYATYNSDHFLNEKTFKQIRRYNKIKHKLSFLSLTQRRMLSALYNQELIAERKYLANNGKITSLITSKYPPILITLFSDKAGLSFFTKAAINKDISNFLILLKDKDNQVKVKQEIDYLYSQLEDAWKQLSSRKL